MRCNIEGCTVKNAIFAFNEEDKKRYCKKHKQDGMIDVVYKKCEHGKRREYCRGCGGTAYCEHGKRKERCVLCGGASTCEHKKLKLNCKQCLGSAYCEHKKRREYCKDCDGSQICKHNRHKYDCKDCDGKGICEHGRQKSRCKECKGSQICKHGRDKSRCKECGGSSLCKFSWCESRKNKKYDHFCYLCYVHLNPDKPVSRNYRTKELLVVDYIKEEFKEYTWSHNKKIQDGCSTRRPDLLLDLGYKVIIVEIDENQHDSYDCSCENKRMMQIYQDLNFRPVVFIRFNPDEYKDEKDNKITGCFGAGKDGLIRVKQNKKKEWIERLNVLKEHIDYWIKNEGKAVETIQLFFNQNKI